MIEYLQNKFKQFLSGLKTFEKDGKTKECFYHDRAKCKGSIKKAHSLQKNGVLNLLESEVSGKKVVYCFQRMKKNVFDQYEGFRQLGKGVASTFYGFCDKHDTELFSPIENHPIDINNEEHKFLLCYRAAARNYHRKTEQIRSFENNSLMNQPELKKNQQDGIEGSKAALKELEEHKKLLNAILETKNYKGLHYFASSINYTIPLACTSVMSPKFYLDNSTFNDSDDLAVPYEHVYLTVVPSQSNTYILYACLPHQEKAIKFINQIEELDDLDLQSITCSLMINEIENGFMSPALFEKLSEEEQQKLIQAIEISDKMRFMQNQFYHLGFNLFDEKYKKN